MVKLNDISLKTAAKLTGSAIAKRVEATKIMLDKRQARETRFEQLKRTNMRAFRAAKRTNRKLKKQQCTL